MSGKRFKKLRKEARTLAENLPERSYTALNVKKYAAKNPEGELVETRRTATFQLRPDTKRGLYHHLKKESK